MKNILEVRNLKISFKTFFGEVEAVRGIDFDVETKKTLAIVGESGCGKSTLLSIISGLIKPTTGEVRVNGFKVDKPLKNVGYMFQKDHLFEWRNILNNVIIGLEIQGKLDNKKISN